MKSIGVIGLGTMGGNLALNIASQKLCKVNVYNRTQNKTKEIYKLAIRENCANYMQGYSTFFELIEASDSAILMLPHGDAFDQMMRPIVAHIPPGYTLIDGANEHYKTSLERGEFFSNHGINYLGVGISGGSRGARNGPSMMIGGSQTAYLQHKHLFDLIANGSSYEYYGNDYGAGHFVKTVHNGIEYAIMQSISEVYHLFGKEVLYQALNVAESIDGFLIQLTKKVLYEYDLDKINDVAQMNDTGLWCVNYANEHKIPIPMISSAVNARFISKYSSDKKESNKRKNVFDEKSINVIIASGVLKFAFACALYEGKILVDSYNLDYEQVLRNWSKGAIISSNMLEKDYMKYMRKYSKSAKQFMSIAVLSNVPAHATYSALNLYNSMRCGKLPADLLMAQRNCFGNHPLEYID